MRRRKKRPAASTSAAALYLQRLEAIADKVDASRALRDLTKAEEDTLWPAPEVWRKPLVGPVADPQWRRYRGQRANEDKAAYVRREVRKAAAKLPPMSVNAQANILSQCLTFEPGVLPKDATTLAVSTLRRILTAG